MGDYTRVDIMLVTIQARPRISTRNRSSAYSADYTRISTRTRYSAYSRTRATNYTRNRSSAYSANYTRNRSSAYTRISARTRYSAYSADYTRNRSSAYTRTSVRDSIVTYASGGGTRYSDQSNLLWHGNNSQFPAWTTGTGSATGFGQNGDGNSRIVDDSPKGQDVVWDISNQDADSNADGGWNSSLFDIDNSKKYRYSVWVRRKVQGNGHFYFGLRGYNSSNSNIGVIRSSNNTVNTNPYPEVNTHWDDWPNYQATLGDWFLVVFHVHPVGTSRYSGCRFRYL